MEKGVRAIEFERFRLAKPSNGFRRHMINSVNDTSRFQERSQLL